MTKIKDRFFCDHVFETIYFDEINKMGIRYHVCTKCGKVVFSLNK